MAIHIAESELERQLIKDASGAFADGLRRRGIPVVVRAASPVQLLEQLRVLEVAPLLIHCVRVDAHDIVTIAASGSPVVHCPASNAKLGHGVAPLVELLAAGITVGLGSDSIASNNRMDLLDEARLALLGSAFGSGLPKRRRRRTCSSWRRSAARGRSAWTISWAASRRESRPISRRSRSTVIIRFTIPWRPRCSRSPAHARASPPWLETCCFVTADSPVRGRDCNFGSKHRRKRLRRGWRPVARYGVARDGDRIESVSCRLRDISIACLHRTFRRVHVLDFARD